MHEEKFWKTHTHGINSGSLGVGAATDGGHSSLPISHGLSCLLLVSGYSPRMTPLTSIPPHDDSLLTNPCASLLPVHPRSSLSGHRLQSRQAGSRTPRDLSLLVYFPPTSNLSARLTHTRLSRASPPSNFSLSFETHSAIPKKKRKHLCSPLNLPASL